jgi:SAM-dependent methyltransferase
VLNKIKKLLMKKEEKDLQIDDLQMKANSEAIQSDFDEITDEEMNAAVDAVELDETTEIETTESDVEEMNESFDDEYLEYSSEAVGYENREQQWDTYRVIANYLEDGDSVIDFGCARGDFERFYLSDIGGDIDYIGVDSNQQLIDAGKKVYNEEVELLCQDWFSLDKDLVQDWSINIGSSNLRYDADTVRDDMTYLKDTITAMMKHCEKGSLILLASDNVKLDDGLISWNAGDIFNWAQKTFGNVAIDHSFSDSIFTLIIYKQ